MVLVKKNLMPKTHRELKEWVVALSKKKDFLILTDVAEDVQNIIKISSTELLCT